jgi:amidase
MPDCAINRRIAIQMLASSSLAVSAPLEIPEICRLTATQMTRLIRQKKVSAREVMEAHLKQIARVNPKVNAIVTLVADRAMENARRADEAQARGAVLGPLHGLPVAHKDLVDTAGIRTTYGSPIYRDHIPKADAIIVESIRNAGAIAIGKTNTPEFGAGSQTFNAVFGATRNPYDLEKTCGGSSGGAAVSLRCGMVPLADGSDSGGSLRNPAAFCNVVGLRVSPGRVASPGWQTLAVSGPLARTVEDAALFLSVIAGPDPRCPISINEPGSRFRADLARGFNGTRIAWFKDLGGVPFAPSIRSVVNANRGVFESLGCIVEETEPDFAGTDEALKIIRAWSYAAAHGEDVRLHRNLVKDTVLWEVDRGLKLTALDITRAEAQRAKSWNQMRLFLEKYDYFILPTTQVPPFNVNDPYPTAINGSPMATYIDWMKACYYISFVENPAISVPCGFTPAGLPVGLQIVGRHRDEWSLLQLAHAFTEATHFGDRLPNL